MNINQGVGSKACARATNTCDTPNCEEFSHRYTVTLLNDLMWFHYPQPASRWEARDLSIVIIICVPVSPYFIYIHVKSLPFNLKVHFFL